jgi:hypothetical protein
VPADGQPVDGPPRSRRDQRERAGEPSAVGGHHRDRTGERRDGVDLAAQHHRDLPGQQVPADTPPMPVSMPMRQAPSAGTPAASAFTVPVT